MDGLCKIHNSLWAILNHAWLKNRHNLKKLNKLNDFNQSEKANEIDPVQKSLLIIQAGVMYTYNECLKERLARL